MTSLEFLRERCLELLTARSIPALGAFPPGARRRYEDAFVLVSVKELSAKSAGFSHYLGERYDAATGTLEERFGLDTEVCFSLDVHAPPDGGEAGVSALCDRLAEALSQETPAGLSLQTLRFGKTGYDESRNLLVAEGEATLSGLLYALRDESGDFISFEVRGGITLE